MGDFLSQHHAILEAFHIISVISWMAGLLYLPRLFVYHADSKSGSDKSETFKIMERRLLRIIMNPAMCAVWLFGGALVWGSPFLLEQGWMHVKLSCVVLMTIYHHILVRWWKCFDRDENDRAPKFYRMWNEVPAVLMVIIVFMVVMRPF
jgi:putative membrane protein